MQQLLKIRKDFRRLLIIQPEITKQLVRANGQKRRENFMGQF